MGNVLADLDGHGLIFLLVQAFRDLTKGTSVKNFLKFVSVPYVFTIMAVVEACLVANVRVSHTSHFIITYGVDEVDLTLRIA